MVKVGPQGRMVIPAPIRRALNILPGQFLLASMVKLDENHGKQMVKVGPLPAPIRRRFLLARAEDGKLLLEKRDQVLARLQDTFTRASHGISLVDELIAERREQARREAED